MGFTIPCELISWNSFYGLCQTLACRIYESGYRPDMIVAIGRGGWVPARVLADFFGVMDLTGFNITHYRGSHMQPEARIKYPLSVGLDDRCVLLVDDVSDSGDTFELALNHVGQHGTPKTIRTAAMHHKLASSFVPDFYAERIVKWRWIIYPWAWHEDISTFIKEMEPPPVSLTEIEQRLEEGYGIRLARWQLRNLLSLMKWDSPEVSGLVDSSGNGAAG